MNIGSIGSGMQGFSGMSGMSGMRRQGGPPPPPKELEGLDPSSSDFATQAADKMLSSMDSDGDGSITAAESKLPDQLFKKLDSSGKGSLSKDDIISGMQGIQAEMQARMQQDGGFMGQMQGGGASMALGIRAYGGQRQGGQGGLDPSASDFSSKMADKMIADMDSDGDGVISSTESKLPDKLFKKLDSSGKGTLSKDDIVKGLDALKAEMQARGQADQSGQDGGQSGNLAGAQDDMRRGIMDALFGPPPGGQSRAA